MIRYLRSLKNLKAPEWIMIAVIIATIAFIFTQSALAPEVSTAESNSTAEFIAKLISTDTIVGRFVFDNVRKIAHFVEYGVLGTEIAIFVLLFVKIKKTAIPKTLIVSFFIAFIDESIQIFSGRGPSISDVWLDVSGYLTFSAITYLFAVAVGKFVKKIQSGR